MSEARTCVTDLKQLLRETATTESGNRDPHDFESNTLSITPPGHIYNREFEVS